MSATSFLSISLIFYQLSMSQASPRHIKEFSRLQTVDVLHGGHVCDKGDYPRILQTCGGYLCPPQPVCLSCVPNGVDALCRRKGFWYSVLVRASRKESSMLTELTCNPRHVNHEHLHCPAGSTCVPDGHGSGTCCYSDPKNKVSKERKLIVAEENCPGWEQCGRCPLGLTCTMFHLSCPNKGRAPCSPRYSCWPKTKVKAGRCPAIPNLTPPLYCQRHIPEERCENDGQCPDDFKCCRPTCGGRSCMKPILSNMD